MKLPFWYNLVMCGIAFAAGAFWKSGWHATSFIFAMFAFMMSIAYCVDTLDPWGDSESLERTD
jgi:hypothetical protein